MTMQQLNNLKLLSSAVHKFAWVNGKRSRYWLPAGKEDIAKNRVYGKRARELAERDANSSAAGNSPQPTEPQAQPKQPKEPASRWRKLALEYGPKLRSIPSMIPAVLATAALGTAGAVTGTPGAVMLGSIGAGGMLNKAMDRGSKRAKQIRLQMAKNDAEKRWAAQRNKNAYFSDAYDTFADLDSYTRVGDRMVSPSGKRKFTIPVFERMKARAAQRQSGESSPAPRANRGNARAAEAMQIMTMKAKVATEAYNNALKAGLKGADLDFLKRRAESAQAELAKGAPSDESLKTVSVGKLPKVKEQTAVSSSIARAGAVVPKQQATATEPPKAVIAESRPVLRRKRTEVGGAPILAVDAQKPKPAQPSRTPMIDRIKAKAQSEIDAVKAGTPNLTAIKRDIENSIVSNRRTNWGYDFTKAREKMEAAYKQVDAFTKYQPPEKVMALAKEVTGEQPRDAEEAGLFMKAWLSETIDLLAGKPQRTKKMSETAPEAELQAAWFSEIQPRFRGARAICAAFGI